MISDCCPFVERDIIELLNTPEGLLARGRDGVIVPAGLLRGCEKIGGCLNFFTASGYLAFFKQRSFISFIEKIEKGASGRSILGSFSRKEEALLL